MPFDPNAHSDLSRYTISALRSVRDEATAAYTELNSSVTDETVSDEQLDLLESYKNFETAVDTELSARTARAARLAALKAQPEGEPEGDDDAADEEPAVTASAEPKTEAPKISDLAKDAPKVEAPTTKEEPHKLASMVASGDIPGLRMNDELDMDTYTKAFMDMAASFEVMGARAQGQISVARNIATIRRNYLDDKKVYGDDRDYGVLTAAANESNLPGGSLRASKKLNVQKLIDETVAKGGSADEVDSLTAAGGWCAPSVTVYDLCFQTVVDGILDTPEVQAPRGGVRHNTGLDWSTIYGGTNILASANGVTGFWNRSEAQVIAGSPVKDSIQVACPSFVDTRLGVTGLWITSPILTNRGYPELVSTFLRGSMAVHAHQMNALAIQAIVAGSGTPVNLTAVDPWQSDGSVTSNLLGAIEMAIVDIKYRLRMARNATMEVVLPYWVRAQFRADLSRRTVGDLDLLAVSDAQIDAWFAQRGANVQFVYDWQDAFTTTPQTGQPGFATTPVSILPATTQFLVYPSGTWVKAVQDVITLNAIYDTTNLPTNTMTQLFAEDGWAMLQMCPVSRVYTVPTCPSGSTTAPSAVDCVTP